MTDLQPVETCLAVPQDDCTGPAADFLDLAAALLRPHADGADAPAAADDE